MYPTTRRVRISYRHGQAMCSVGASVMNHAILNAILIAGRIHHICIRTFDTPIIIWNHNNNRLRHYYQFLSYANKNPGAVNRLYWTVNNERCTHLFDFHVKCN